MQSEPRSAPPTWPGLGGFHSGHAAREGNHQEERVFDRAGRALQRGDRVLVADEQLLPEMAPRVGVVVAFTEREALWHAVIVLEAPASDGLAIVEALPSEVVWLPPTEAPTRRVR